MSDIVIKAENLGKKYLIGHQAEGQGKYSTLRDVLTQGARSLWRKTRDLASGRPIIQGDSLEEVWALKDVNFEIRQGEVVGIIGRNGAGKSTLLKILSRITEPSVGRVTIKGRVSSLLEVGTGFHPELSGRENIYLNGAILGMTRAEIKSKFDEIVAFAEVEKYLDTPVKRYSSGMYVRLAFAVAAHLEPEILMVDEVLAVGDAQFQKKCLGKMGDVAKEGRTVLFVSHNMAALQQLCSKGILLSKGKIICNGTANNVVDRYINLSEKIISCQKDGYIDLEQVRDKEYVSKIFKKIRIIDDSNIPRGTFPMLSSIKIEIELENTENFPGMDYGISIETAIGQRITSFATWMLKEKKQVPKMIVIEIPKIMFSAGSYRVSLSMTHPKEGTYIDKIISAASFSVEGTDIFNTGRQFDSDYGLFLQEANFLLK